MLLLHQAGSVKIGELVRYTLTYTPSHDRILPTPKNLYVKIKNTSAIPLRAAYLHGPYTLHVAAYPKSFDPYHKVEHPKRDGTPEFEPYLKAGGSWTARLVIPDNIRETGVGDRKSLERRKLSIQDEEAPSATWIIEITSQILFSNSANVGFELLVGRDERSLEIGFAAIAGQGHGEPGKLQDHQQGAGKKSGRHPGQPKGVYSKSVKLVVDDTTSLWNKPALPEWSPEEKPKIPRQGSIISNRSLSLRRSGSRRGSFNPEERRKKQQKVHLVVVTHGLHSNLGADMLYLKESIDAAAAQARMNARKRRREAKEAANPSSNTASAQERPSSSESDNNATPTQETTTAPLSGGQEKVEKETSEEDADEDDEMVVVRGFNGNAVRTEKGIQYLGKRLAKYVLELTYPDQPFMPVKKSMSRKLTNALTPAPSKDKPKDKPTEDEGVPAHSGSSIHLHPHRPDKSRAYRYTSISFIGHSLGGLVQTYAIAYIRKHSPTFFEKISPINFVCMASPMLGLSNENPMYVKFALDFGLVGKTGQDLGLTWQPTNMAKSGWSAMSSVFSTGPKEHQEEDPSAKPLLRILPTGPAHQVLRLFRNRTLYSNVVNDGIVPLRTSCLLFLDWRGLGKVEKARRENGLIGTMASWGFSELTGQNSSRFASEDIDSGAETPTGNGSMVPQPSNNLTNQDDKANAAPEPASHQFLDQHHESSNANTKNKGPIDTLWSYIRPSGKLTKNDKRMFSRSQILGSSEDLNENEQARPESGESSSNNTDRPRATRGDSLLNDPTNSLAPPKTTVFESGVDLLNPPIPPKSWIIDPHTRARTIFHDRVYHPEDIPPPPAKKPRMGRTFSSISQSSGGGSTDSGGSPDGSGMRVEEKIARAYHKDLSWRKVLVRLEPDAHNNIIVRRMFANAYGWPVVKHLCDTHFADTWSAQTRDEYEPTIDRAKAADKPVGEDGEEVKGQADRRPLEAPEEQMRERADELKPGSGSSNDPPELRGLRRYERTGTASTFWDDSYLDDRTSDDDDDEEDTQNPIQRFQRLLSPAPPKRKRSRQFNSERQDSNVKGTSEVELNDFLRGQRTASPPPMEGHRGLHPVPASGGSSGRPSTKSSSHEPDSEQITPMVDRQFTSTPPPMEVGEDVHHPGELAQVGLRKSMENAISSSPPATRGNEIGTGTRGRSESHGVTEQVARLSMTKHGDVN